MDRVVTIELFGQSYSFKANADKTHIEEIVLYVVKEVEKAKASGEMPSNLDSVILAALNIASEYFEAIKNNDTLIQDVNQRCEALVEYIDRNI